MARVDDTSSSLSFESRTSSPVHDIPVFDHDDHNSCADEDSDDDREINLSLSVRCTVPSEVKKTDTLKELKLACSKEGVSEQLLNYFFEQHGLNDEQTYGDAMSVLSRRLIIKVPSDTPHLKTTVIAKVNDTIGVIKSMASDKMSLDSPSYDLMFRGKYLESHVTLESLNIPNDSTFYLVEHPCETLTIIVIIPEKKPIAFDVKKIHTIWDAKTIAGTITDLDVEKATLMLDGYPTDELRTFDSYHIPDKSIFELVFPFKVYVKVIGGPKVMIEVLPCDRVEDLNQKATKALRWTLNVHPFFYHSAKLQSGFNISHYGITEGCTLLMGPRVLY